jgi:hypothetical protein
MGMMEEVGERAGIGAGWMVGIGIAAVALLGPSLVRVMRPATKQAMKGYMAARDRAREAVAETSERMQDLYEEAKHEYDTEHQQKEMEAEEAPHRHETGRHAETHETAASRRHRTEEES